MIDVAESTPRVRGVERMPLELDDGHDAAPLRAAPRLAQADDFALELADLRAGANPRPREEAHARDPAARDGQGRVGSAPIRAFQARFLRTPRSASKSTGFTTCASKPASIARCRSSGVPYPVIAIMYGRVVPVASRRRRATS